MLKNTIRVNKNNKQKQIMRQRTAQNLQTAP